MSLILNEHLWFGEVNINSEFSAAKPTTKLAKRRRMLVANTARQRRRRRKGEWSSWQIAGGLDSGQSWGIAKLTTAWKNGHMELAGG